MKGRDKKLPALRHGFQSATAKAVGIDRNTAPAEDSQAFLVSGSLDGGFGGRCRVRWKESETQAELIGELDSLLGGLCLKEGFGERGKQASTIAAGSIGIDTAPMGEALESGECVVNNLVAWMPAKLRDKAGATGVMVRVAPVGAHTGGHLPLAPVVRQVHTCL